jgi:hypothetical protein
MNAAYKMDFASKTLTLTKAFSDACADPTSKEYAILTHFQRDFPDLKIVRKTHKSAKSANQFKNLTYENMERFMNALPQREEYLKVYNYLRYDAGLVQTSAYKTVRDWFMAQFPKFRSNPLLYINNTVEDIKPNFEEGRQENAA